MPKGEVESDRQAFQQVLGRLEAGQSLLTHRMPNSNILLWRFPTDPAIVGLW